MTSPAVLISREILRTRNKMVWLFWYWYRINQAINQSIYFTNTEYVSRFLAQALIDSATKFAHFTRYSAKNAKSLNHMPDGHKNLRWLRGRDRQWTTVTHAVKMTSPINKTAGRILAPKPNSAEGCDMSEESLYGELKSKPWYRVSPDFKY